MNKKKILFFCIRGLGDTVIQSFFISNLIKNNPNEIFYVITNNRNKRILELYKSNNLKIISFDVSRDFNFLTKLRIIFNLVKISYKLRNEKIDYGFETSGDYREYLLFKLFFCKLFFIKFPKNHLFSKIIKPINYLSVLENNFFSYVPKESTINIYEIFEIFFQTVAKKINLKFTHNAYLNLKKCSNRKKINKNIKIALNPFATVLSNNWSLVKWEELAKKLLRIDNISIYIFYSKTDEDKLNKFYKHKRIHFKCLTISAYLNNIRNMDLSISSDSFSSHISHYYNLRNIIIYGSNNYKLFQPPNSISFFNSGGCKYYPCYNIPKCVDTSFEYTCINSITSDEVYEKTKLQLIN